MESLRTRLDFDLRFQNTDLPRDPEYQPLCKRCRDMCSTKKGLRALTTEKGYLHYEREGYEKKALRGCPLCQLFLNYSIDFSEHPLETRWKAVFFNRSKWSPKKNLLPIWYSSNAEVRPFLGGLEVRGVRRKRSGNLEIEGPRFLTLSVNGRVGRSQRKIISKSIDTNHKSR